MSEKIAFIRFRVHGEPQPWPKKENQVIPAGRDPRTGRMKFRVKTFERDYHTRKNPITGKTEKYGYGYIARYKRELVAAAKEAMAGRPPFGKAVPLYLLKTFWRTRPKSNRSRFPVTTPDVDNYGYLVHNVLEGVCYANDSQITDSTELKRWADDDNPPGVLIILGPMTTDFALPQLALDLEACK